MKKKNHLLIYGKMAAQADRGVPLSTVRLSSYAEAAIKPDEVLCPKFLHTNSTSHTWPFSAIAELIDNAYDPDVNAKHFWIDKTVVQGQECLSFMDSGSGLNLETIHKMLSFGYSDKTALKGVKPIGMYGNGFKSGAMRLGKDAIVFSKSKTTSCVGMLSQTYLEEIKAKQIVVPIVCFQQSQTNSFGVAEGQHASLRDILRYSPFKTQEELLKEIETISSSFYESQTGTRIIIWNLRGTSSRQTEFDFETDRYDIRIPTDFYEEMDETAQPGRIASHIPQSLYSLRAYCSILYLKPHMQIIIRGSKVKSELIEKSLAFVRRDLYKPTFLNSKPIRITFGYNTKSKDQYGVMMYHKNRLIKPYERVGCQLKANNKGVGVIGVIECGLFLEPTHNKQSFNETDKYRKTMTNLGIKLEEYWNEIRHRRQTEDPNNNIPVEDTTKKPDQNWVQCDDCMKWRKLPDGIDPSKLPDKWSCNSNPDPQFRSCQVQEEAQDSDDDTPAYRKTYKQQERVIKRNLEMRRKREEDLRLAALAKQNQALQRQKEDLQWELQLRDITSNSPSTSTNMRRQGGAAGARSSPSSNGLPVISSVCSLSSATMRGKRPQPDTSLTTPKRPRVNGLHSNQSSPSLLDDSSNSQSLLVNDDDDETDDDILILEDESTPKPKKPAFDLKRVKTEQGQGDANVGMLLECSDDAAVDVAMETSDKATDAAGAGPPPQHSNSTTQTEVPEVKTEKESQSLNEGEEGAGQSTAEIRERERSKDVDVCSTENNHLDNKGDSEASCADVFDKSASECPSIIEAQAQQDELLNLMSSTAQERDSFKDVVHRLTCQLQDMQSKLEELTRLKVKRECSHQASQTEETGKEGCYKSLFEKAKQKVDELIKDKEHLLSATESKPGTTQGEEQETDEIAVQVDALLRELDERNKERDELHSRLDKLEKEKATLASRCEELRLSLQQQQRENIQDKGASPHSSTDCSARPKENGATNSSSNASKSLIELRHNIGRLLISYVPALDLSQVNYECNVIDEILEQVLCDNSSMEPMGLNHKSMQ